MTVFLAGLRTTTLPSRVALKRVGVEFRVPVLLGETLEEVLNDRALNTLPHEVEVVAIEATRQAYTLPDWFHPHDEDRDVLYVVGPIAGTLTEDELKRADFTVKIPMRNEHFYSPDHAAAIVLYDRMVKGW